MTIWITSGDRPSSSRRALQGAGGFRKLRGVVPDQDYIINWGCSNLNIGANRLLNNSYSVRLASNKLHAFEAMDENNVSVVPWSAQKLDAQGWLDSDRTVVVRETLTGHSGHGIVIVEPGDVLPDAPLYTRYIYKTHEYRFHVVRSQIIDVQKKIRDPAREPQDWKVRSHQNGFIFARNGFEVTDNLRQLSIAAVASLGLDFGAVDIIVDKNQNAYCLEVNTAPGLEGQTVQSYAQALRQVCGG